MLYFKIAYEGNRNSNEVVAAVECTGDQVIEAFDGSHVDGSRIVLVMVEAHPSTVDSWKRKLQDSVWRVNSGLYCNVMQLTEEAYDDFC